MVTYEMPEYDATIKLKANSSAIAENTAAFWPVIFGWIEKY